MSRDKVILLIVDGRGPQHLTIEVELEWRGWPETFQIARKYADTQASGILTLEKPGGKSETWLKVGDRAWAPLVPAR